MTYVYKCRTCGERYEAVESIRAEPQRTHAGGCGGKVFRVPQLARVVYYGAGFHCNDYGTRFKIDTGPPEPGN